MDDWQYFFAQRHICANFIIISNAKELVKEKCEKKWLPCERQPWGENLRFHLYEMGSVRGHLLGGMCVPMIRVCVVIVVVDRLIALVDMGVRVDVLMLVRVDQVAVAVRVGMGVGVFMCVLQRNGVLDHQHGCGDHQRKPEEEAESRLFSKQKSPEQHPQKGGDRILCTGFGGAQILLRFDV